MIKLVALDVDGTIIKESGIPMTDRVCAAMNAASKMAHVILCTGRSSEELSEVLDQVELPPSYHVCGGGSEIIKPDGKLFAEQLLTEKELAIIEKEVSKVQKGDVYYLVGTSWTTTCIKEDRSKVGIVSLDASSHEDAYNRAVSLGGLTTLFSVSVASDSRDPQKAVIHISSKMSNKGTGLLRVMAELGIEKEESMMVGDMLNDVPAFEVVGLKVAMGNAAPHLKSLADFVAPDIEDDGAAVAIERFVLKKS